MDKLALEEHLIEVLKTIYDPEIPVDIVELGLIYEVKINDDKSVYIRMTLTTPNCPVADSLPKEVEDKIKDMEWVTGVELDLVFEPAWEMTMMSEEAKLELGFL